MEQPVGHYWLEVVVSMSASHLPGLGRVGSALQSPTEQQGCPHTLVASRASPTWQGELGLVSVPCPVPLWAYVQPCSPSAPPST